MGRWSGGATYENAAVERPVTSLAWSDSGAGPAIVLLHAFPCDHRMWEHQAAGLREAGWRVLVPDLPGFGSSALPDAVPSLGVVVDLLASDLMELGVDRMILVGLSVGGYLTMEWLRRYPEMLAGIALCDTKATADTPAALQGRLDMAAIVETEPDRTSALLRERMLPVIVGGTTHGERPDVVAMVASWIDAADPGAISWYQRAMAERVDSLVVLSESHVPALVLWGEEDSMSDRAEQDLMLRALRDARFATIAQAGHLSAIENPESVAAELVTFAGAVRRSTLDG
jgi:pimeloyl-ACP methyl ester carboxylesterase